MAEILIEPYTQKYQQGVIDLILYIQQVEYNIPIKKEDQPDLLNIENFYQTGKANFWVALARDQVVGTIAMIDLGNQQVALRKMFVQADYRGKVYNTANLLLKKFIQWTQAQDIQEVYLGTTDKFLAAHRFYEKNHFVQIEPANLPGTFPVMKVDTRFYKLTV